MCLNFNPETYGVYNPIHGIVNNSNADTVRVIVPIHVFFHNENAFLTLLICFERFMVIVFPMKSKTWCSKQRTLIYIGVPILLGLVNLTIIEVTTFIGVTGYDFKFWVIL